jgi:hypothetical protein
MLFNQLIIYSKIASTPEVSLRGMFLRHETFCGVELRFLILFLEKEECY